MWAMSGTCHILASRMAATALHWFMTTSSRAKISFCFTRVYMLTMFLVSVDSDTTNPKSTLTRTKPSASTRTKPSASTRTKYCFHAAVRPLPCSAHAPLTQQWRRSRAVLTPLLRSNDDAHALRWRPCHAAMTQLQRSADAPFTQHWRRSRAMLTQLTLREWSW